MAKKSSIQKNLKRMKLVDKYARKREKLKKIVMNKKLELSERFAAQLKLDKLPKNSSKVSLFKFNFASKYSSLKFSLCVHKISELLGRFGIMCFEQYPAPKKIIFILADIYLVFYPIKSRMICEFFVP